MYALFFRLAAILAPPLAELAASYIQLLAADAAEDAAIMRGNLYQAARYLVRRIAADNPTFSRATVERFALDALAVYARRYGKTEDEAQLRRIVEVAGVVP